MVIGQEELLAAIYVLTERASHFRTEAAKPANERTRTILLLEARQLERVRDYLREVAGVKRR